MIHLCFLIQNRMIFFPFFVVSRAAFVRMFFAAATLVSKRHTPKTFLSLKNDSNHLAPTRVSIFNFFVSFLNAIFG